MRNLVLLLLLVPILGTAQSYKLVDSDYPEITMKLIENDTINAELILSNKIIDGYVVYKQIKRLDNKNVYRYPISFLDSKKERIEGVMYYEPHFNDTVYWSPQYGFTPYQDQGFSINDVHTDLGIFIDETHSLIEDKVDNTKKFD